MPIKGQFPVFFPVRRERLEGAEEACFQIDDMRVDANNQVKTHLRAMPGQLVIGLLGDSASDRQGATLENGKGKKRSELKGALAAIREISSECGLDIARRRELGKLRRSGQPARDRLCVGRRIREMRGDITQAEFAERIGISQTYPLECGKDGNWGGDPAWN